MPDHRSDTPTGPQPGSIVVVGGPVGVGKSTVSRLVAAAFDRSVHLQVDDVMASIVSGWIDPNLPEAADQNEAIGGALAVSAMGFAQHGYTAVVDGSLFPDGVAGLAEAASARGLSCHYAVLHADLTTCWARAERRGQSHWPLERESFERLHARYATLDVDERHRIDAAGPPTAVSDTVLAALRSQALAVTP